MQQYAKMKLKLWQDGSKSFGLRKNLLAAEALIMAAQLGTAVPVIRKMFYGVLHPGYHEPGLRLHGQPLSCRLSTRRILQAY